MGINITFNVDFHQHKLDTDNIKILDRESQWFRDRPDSIPLRQFLNSMENVLNMAYKRYERVVLMGDHNVDLLTQNNERNKLLDFCDAFDLKSIIQDTTCHVGDIFTNKPRSCLTKGVLDNGISDVHRLIYSPSWYCQCLQS